MNDEQEFFRQLKTATNDDERAWLITKRLLDSLPENLQKLVYAASVSQWFDKNVLKVLCPRYSDSIDQLYSDLIVLPFVEPFGDRGYNIHELTRRLILDFLWKEKRDLFTDLSNRAYEYFRGGRLLSSSRNFWRGDSIKRIFDVIVSLLGLIVLSPFFLLVAISIRLKDPGPVFYHGPRVGKNGRPFDILKFRTTLDRPESYEGSRITINDDDCITPFGRWLRETKLNELPQLWNVLIGDMSLVGPRPEDPEIVKSWPAEVREEILSIRPGITSPASILYRDEENALPADGVMDAYFRDILPDKLRINRLYVRNHSLTSDLDVLLWTVIASLSRIERQHIPESKLFTGPLSRFVQRHVSWFLLDLLICMAAVTLSGIIARLFAPLYWGFLPLLLLAIILAVLFSLVNVFLGLDRIIWSRAGAEDGLVLLFSNGISVTILLLVNYLYEQEPWMPLPALPTGMIVLIGVFTLVGTLFARYRMRLVTVFADRLLSWRWQRGGFGERVLILGAGEGGQIVNWLLRRDKLRQVFHIVGMVDDDPAKQGMRIDGCWVLGSTSDIPYLVRKHDIGVILFTISNLQEEEHNNLLKLCQTPGVRLIFLTDIMGTIQSQLVGRYW